MIRQYTNKKDNKKNWEIKNEYIGKNIFTGKEKRLNKKGFNSKREAVNHVTKIKSEFQQGKCVDNSKLDFNDLHKLFDTSYKGTVKDTTYQAMTRLFNKILNKFEKIKVQEVKAPLLQLYINELSQEYSKNYVTHIKIALNMLLDYAVKLDIIQTNYLKFVKIPLRIERKKDNFYTKVELLEFLAIVKDNYDIKYYLAFHLLAFTGLRHGELLTLTWSDIDFKARTLTVNKAINYVDKKYIISTTKTIGGNRTIYLDNATIDLLKQYRLTRNILINNYLFENRTFGFLQTFKSRLYKKYPHLKKITVHGFRHTHASLLYASGVPVKDISNRLGHKDITTTLNIYTHLTEEKQKDTTELLSSYMAK